MAEERARGAAEGEWRRLEDPDYVWEGFRPRAGDIVEFETGLVEGHLHSGHYGAYLVTSTRETGEGSLELSGRCVGCNHEEAGKTLSSLLNRKQQPLHLCHSMPCTYEEMEGVVHVIAARWFNCATFEASYMKPWGKLVIKEYLQADEAEETEAPGGRRRSVLKRPAGAAAPRRAGPRTAGKTAGLDGAKLRDKLRRLRGRGAGEDAKKGDEVITVEESEVSEYIDNSDSAEEDGSPELSGEPLSPRTSLAIKDKVKSEPKGAAEGGGKKKKRKRKSKERLKDKDPGLQLLAQAAQVRQARKEEMSGKDSGRRSSSTSGKVKELVKALLGGKKSKGKKKKKNGARASAPGGDPDSPGESSEESDREEDASESSSSEMLAPLQRKSSKKPGTVLRLLIQHAKHALDQTSVVETKEASDITCGVKMTSYFNLMIRPYHPNNNLMKELNHLSVCLDELRAGELGKLGGFPCFPLPGPAHGGERGHVESGSIPGASSSRSYPGSPCLSPPGGTETREDGEQSTGRRGVASTSPRRRLMAGERKRRWQQRKGPRKRQGLAQAGRRRRGLAGKKQLEQGRRRRKLVGQPKGEAGEQRSKAGREGSQEVRSLEDETPEGSCPVTRSLKGDKGLGFFRLCCDDGRSLRQLGVMMAWLVSQGTPVDGAGGVLTPLSCILPPMVFQGAGLAAVHRTLKKGALPLRLGGLEALIVRLKGCTYQDILAPSFSLQHSTESWMLLSLLYINWMHGCRGAPRGRWRKSDETALFNVQASVERILRKDTEITRSAAQVEKELSNRFVTYTGEEVAKMEPLTFDQVFPALPPMGHGGSIPILEWTKGRTRTFLNRPSDCVASDCGQKLPKLQAKVHIVETDRMKVAALLVSRNICSWVELDSVFKYRGTTVLNGMFGVAKSATLDDSRPHLRVIMNLIPSNSVMEQLTGCVHELPGITQYMSITLGPDETLRLCQSDMTSAFYLFALPPQWRPYLAFNLVVDGADIGRVVGTQYALACGVLPMGWASAVSVMQEASQLLLDRHGLPRDAMVTRTRPPSFVAYRSSW